MHADRNGILAWLSGARQPPKNVHLVHGEPDAARALSAKVREELKLNVHIPQYLENVEV